MIRNIYQLKTELITRNISNKDEMSGCSEKEIVEIETKYGKLPLSYREIISLIGHNAGFLAGDSSLYVSTEPNIDRNFVLTDLKKQIEDSPVYIFNTIKCDSLKLRSSRN